MTDVAVVVTVMSTRENAASHEVVSSAALTRCGVLLWLCTCPAVHVAS
jgi:hypothetical protein